MTPNQKALRNIDDELEGIETRSAEIVSGESITDEMDVEIRELAGKKKNLLERRSAVRLLLDDDDKRSFVHDLHGVDSETRERLELRGKSRLTNFFLCAVQGKEVSGPELELRQAAGVDGIPLEIFDTPDELEKKGGCHHGRPPAGSGLGVNLDPIRPRIYARSVLPRMGVAMPQVPSGTYSTATISTGLTAGARVAGMPRDSMAAAFAVGTTTPHSISARLTIRIEDILSVGAENYESVLRQNLQLALADAVDSQGLSGDGSGANLTGLLEQLTDPTVAPTAVIDWNGWASLIAAGVDGGPWAESAMDVRLLVNPESMRLAISSFKDGTGFGGEKSAAMYLKDHSGGFFSSRRMPDSVSMIAQAIRYRNMTQGLMGVDAMRTAVMPVWDEIGIDDIFSDSASGLRHFTLHNFCGDVLVIQPDAYEQIQFQVSA